ncbi:hypothetical protein LOK49_LG05G01424 [Camellia lanceoleosa]|uniref:Uncharacterized protein n=1 Tax=Camellia lanceoleosa TaxID=1840588 RepID=A0ACC0HTE9_9ERIC|nr:hypothetical protein LOK49_LG05G01424 [Camellia lanceoleosa]
MMVVCLVVGEEMRSIDTDKNSAELDMFRCSETEDKVGATANPKIVARLMGLESSPQIDLANTQMNPNSISGSRSLNFDS